MPHARASTVPHTSMLDADNLHPDMWWSQDLDMGVFTFGTGRQDQKFVRNAPFFFATAPVPQLMLDAKNIGTSQYYPGDCIERKHAAGFAVEMVLEGCGELVVNRRRYELRPGDVFILHPDEHHRYRCMAGGMWRKQYVTFWPRDERVRRVMTTLGLTTLSHLRLDVARHARCADLFARMHTCAQAAAPGFRAQLSALVYELLLELVAVTHELDQTAQVPEPVARAVAMAQQAGRAGIKVADLARAAGRSPTHLFRLFQQTFGMGTHEWLEKFRLRNAAILLRNSGKRLHEIAEEVGYEDPFYFSIAFKRIAGMSPSEYRRCVRLDRLPPLHAAASGTGAWCGVPSAKPARRRTR